MQRWPIHCQTEARGSCPVDARESMQAIGSESKNARPSCPKAHFIDEPSSSDTAQR